MRLALPRVLGALLALAGAGCSSTADGGACDSCDPSASVDAGATSDAGERDVVDAGGAGVPPVDQEGTGDLRECFDGLDNDGFGGADCEESACSALPICCVGETSSVCCTVAMPGVALGPLDDCAAGPAASCPALAGATLFGSPEPYVDESGRLVPNGGESSDSGLVLAGEVRPRVARVEVRARIAAPRGCPGCVDSVAISLVPVGAIDPSALGVVGLLVSGSRGDVSLVIGGALAWSYPLPDDAEHEYVLGLDPEGVVSLTTDTPAIAATTAAAALPDAALRVVVHGRTSNRSGTSAPPARLRSLEVTSWGCDVPDSLARATSPLASPAMPPWEGGEREPSVARPRGGGPDSARLAFAADGAIWIARPDGSDGFRVDGSAPALHGVPSAIGGLRDPELVPLADRWLLLFTAIDDRGRRRVARVAGEEGWSETFDASAARDVLPLPIDDPEGTIVELDGASALSVDGELHVVARAIRADGTTTLVLLGAPELTAADEDFTLRSVCGTGCGSIAAPTTLAVHRPRTADPTAFDHDEVAAPALALHDGVYRLYYAGRRGTRWAIGLLVSPDLRIFRAGNDGAPVLSASGMGADALGVLDPEPWIHDGTFELLYTASDGARATLGRAAQPLLAR